MQMRQQLMENEHKMMQKIMRAMARNRAIRCELKHLKKMAYRAQPGNCDCCGMKLIIFLPFSHFHKSWFASFLLPPQQHPGCIISTLFMMIC